MGMWMEILPSVFIMTAVFMGGDAAGKLFHKALHGVVSKKLTVQVNVIF